MSFNLNMPPSEIGKLARSEQSAGPGDRIKQSREDWKKAKELEEARKAGTAPAMKDEEGKDINPHIPQYIMQAPWYFGSQTATLRHQRPQTEKFAAYDQLSAEIKRGLKSGPVATKYRKGACENCGAMTHNKKDCLERPRKVGARYTGEKIAPDELIPKALVLDFEGKRDLWKNFDARDHQQKLFEEFRRMEEAKQLMKEEALEETLKHPGEDPKTDGAVDGGDDDEDKYAEDMDMPGQKFETKNRITVRNLRIREDTAKYLFNLDPNSAYYDPKTRSMRQNPLEGTKKECLLSQYTGDNFVRGSGDAHEYAKQQLFAWEAYEKGADVHLQADPTKLELLSKEFKNRRDQFKKSVKDSVLEHYGGLEHMEDAPPKQLLLAQTEDYIEYSRHGTVIKGQEKARVKSRYEEDVYPNNHQESALVPAAPVTKTSPSRQKEREGDKKKKKRKKMKRKHKKHAKRESGEGSSSDSDSGLDEQRKRRMMKALRAEDDHNRAVSEQLMTDERCWSYNSMREVKAPTAEEIEAFQMRQIRPADPMSQSLAE